MCGDMLVSLRVLSHMPELRCDLQGSLISLTVSKVGLRFPSLDAIRNGYDSTFTEDVHCPFPVEAF